MKTARCFCLRSSRILLLNGAMFAMGGSCNASSGLFGAYVDHEGL